MESFFLFRLLLFHDFSSFLNHSIVLLRSSRLNCLLITLAKMMRWSGSLWVFQSWVYNLVLLVHVSSKMCTWSRLTELERPGYSCVFGFFQLFHLCDERFLKSSKVWNWSGACRLEWEKLFSLLTLLSWLKIVFPLSSLFINVSLHSGWELWSCKVRLRVSSDSLLSFVFIPLHHHLEAGNKDAPRYVTRSELIQHGLVDIIVSESTLSSL